MTPREAFQQLAVPSTPGAFGLGAEVCPGCRIAISHEGHLALAVAVEPTGASTKRRFENLSYDPPRMLRVFSGDASREESLATLVCRTKDAGLEDAFLRIAIALLDSPPGALSERDLEHRLDELVSLFRALGMPATQTIQGLWAELAIILWSSDVSAALAAWHSSPRALHDFASGADRLEVKSCGSGLREHALRLEQLHEAPGGRTLFASIVVTPDDEGETVSDLASRIRERVGDAPELLRRLETIVTRSLGRDWRDAAKERFSEADARRELGIYEASRIPSVPGPLPVEVKHVSFTVDLSTTPALTTAEARAVSPFFAQVFAAEP